MSKPVTQSSVFWIAILGALVLLALVAPVLAPGEREPLSAPVDDVATVGDTLETYRGVFVQLRGLDYEPNLPDSLFLDEPLGGYVAVSFHIANESDEPITIYRRTVEGSIGSRTYEAESLFSSSADAELVRDINPGLSAGFVAYIDIPAGEALDQVVFDSPGFGDSLVFDVSD